MATTDTSAPKRDKKVKRKPDGAAALHRRFVRLGAFIDQIDRLLEEVEPPRLKGDVRYGLADVWQKAADEFREVALKRARLG